MSKNEKIPELKTIIGAMIFSANRSLNIKDIKKCLKEVSESDSQEGKAFAGIQNSDIEMAIKELREDIEKMNCGFILAEIADGFRFQSDLSCGIWVRHLLAAGRPTRLSLPALETLAIIAYRQPISKADIEFIRGVNVDHIIKSLLAAQLIRIVGRSDMPGRPFLYGTTQTFLEHFGLKSLKDLGDMEPFLAAMKEHEAKRSSDDLQNQQNISESTESGVKQKQDEVIPDSVEVKDDTTADKENKAIEHEDRK